MDFVFVPQLAADIYIQLMPLYNTSCWMNNYVDSQNFLKFSDRKSVV